MLRENSSTASIHKAAEKAMHDAAVSTNQNINKLDKVEVIGTVIELLNQYVQSENPSDLLNHLLNVGAHLGHPTKARNPAMDEFIMAVKNKAHVIDLKATIKYLIKALSVIYTAARNNHKILFVCTADQMHDIVSEQATRCLQFHITSRWPGGLLTNWNTVKHSLKTLKKLEDTITTEIANDLKKKEIIQIQRQIKKIRSTLGGVEHMHDKPSLVIISSIIREKTAVEEVLSLKKLGVKIRSIALADTNSNPNLVDYPIPANDDSIRVIEFFFKLFANTVLKGLSDSDSSHEFEMELAQTDIASAE